MDVTSEVAHAVAESHAETAGALMEPFLRDEYDMKALEGALTSGRVSPNHREKPEAPPFLSLLAYGGHARRLWKLLLHRANPDLTDCAGSDGSHGCHLRKTRGPQSTQGTHENGAQGPLQGSLVCTRPRGSEPEPPRRLRAHGPGSCRHLPDAGRCAVSDPQRHREAVGSVPIGEGRWNRHWASDRAGVTRTRAPRKPLGGAPQEHHLRESGGSGA